MSRRRRKNEPQIAVKKSKSNLLNNFSREQRLQKLHQCLDKSTKYARHLIHFLEQNPQPERKTTLQSNYHAARHTSWANQVHRTESISSLSSISSTSTASTQSTSRRVSTRSSRSCLSPGVKRKAESQLNGRRVGKKQKQSVQQSALVGRFNKGDKVIVKKSTFAGAIKAKILDVIRTVTQTFMYRVDYKPETQTRTLTERKEWLEEKYIISNSTNEPPRECQSVNNVSADMEFIKKRYHSGDCASTRSATLKIRDGRRHFNTRKVPFGQPYLFSGGTLRDYQIAGVKWLGILFDSSNEINGILADEMGLGKTIQCIAFICRLVECGMRGPFLVCAPLSTIFNWFAEFKHFAPQLPAIMYHGSKSERAALRPLIGHVSADLKCLPVVITSYDLVMKDRRHLSRYTWNYLVVDEGHRLKNITCRLLSELRKLRVTSKVLLTGTPLQNNLIELWTLLNFLLPEVFNDLGTFDVWFNVNKLQRQRQDITEHTAEDMKVVAILHKILAPFILRRTKADVELSIPQKREIMIFAPSTPKQTFMYQKLAEHGASTCRKRSSNNRLEDIIGYNLRSNKDPSSAEIINQTRRELRSTRSMQDAKRQIWKSKLNVDMNISFRNMMMQLRKCCNHPYLLEYPLVAGTDIYKVDSKLITVSGKLRLLDKMLATLLKQGHKILIFSQMTRMLDVLEDYCNYRKYEYVRIDGTTSCDKRHENITTFSKNSQLRIFLLSTRAGGVGVNLTAADTVIIYDSDWNPQNDLQAQDRCHRIGQSRPVVIYRLVLKDTVDQVMVQRAEAKRILERLVIGGTKYMGELVDDAGDDNVALDLQAQVISALQETPKSNSSACCRVSNVELTKLLDREWIMNTNEQSSELFSFTA